MTSEAGTTPPGGNNIHRGHCRCGAIRAEASADPFWRSYCHCEDCRRQTGAPLLAFVGFREEALTWSGTPRTWMIRNATRSFCGTCGSQIAYRDDRLTGEVYLVLGFMETPKRYAPTLHAFTSRALPFLHLKDELPRYSGFSVER